MLNSDGIDIDSSRLVTVSDCIIETGDDAITLRGCEQRLKNKNIHFNSSSCNVHFNSYKLHVCVSFLFTFGSIKSVLPGNKESESENYSHSVMSLYRLASQCCLLNF